MARVGGAKAAAIFFILLVSAAASGSAYGQCLDPAETQRIVEGVNSVAATVINENLRDELIKLKADVLSSRRVSILQRAETEQTVRGKKTAPLGNDVAAPVHKIDPQRIASRLKDILKTMGYPGKSLVGADGASAGLYLLKNFIPLECQTGILTVVSAAVSAKELPQDIEYASFIDRFRIRSGRKQIFGTQVYIKDDLFIVRQIESGDQVDERRSKYAMAPLAADLKYLENVYKTATLREQSGPGPSEQQPDETDVQLADRKLRSSLDDDEVIRVRSDLVSLNVRVSDTTPSAAMPLLNAADFRVYEDESEEEITFFAKTETPFDLVLLLDLSGSTVRNQALIRKAATRFIEMARQTDRISIVTFTSAINVVTPLTSDRRQLLASVKKIKDTGDSYVWGSLAYVLKNSFGDRPPGRRRAVVMMSDGVDSTLTNLPRGSEISFAQLLETVRNDDTLVIPIYLNTDPKARFYTKRIHGISRRTVYILAAESGGQVYEVKKLEDLDGQYEKVLGDLASVYSIGNTPSREARDGTWRTLRVEVRGALNFPPGPARGITQRSDM